MKEPYDRSHKLYLAGLKKRKKGGFKHDDPWKPKDPGNKRAFKGSKDTYNFDLTKYPVNTTHYHLLIFNRKRK